MRDGSRWLRTRNERGGEMTGKMPTVEEVIETVHNDVTTWNNAVTRYPLWIAAIRMAYDVIASRIESKGVENGKD